MNVRDEDGIWVSGLNSSSIGWRQYAWKMNNVPADSTNRYAIKITWSSVSTGRFMMLWHHGRFQWYNGADWYQDRYTLARTNGSGLWVDQNVKSSGGNFGGFFQEVDVSSTVLGIGFRNQSGDGTRDASGIVKILCSHWNEMTVTLYDEYTT